MASPRPGGRTERNRAAVAAAVLELIREGDLLFDLQAVAARSGVHRTTIARRWANRDALLIEAMGEHTAQFSIDVSGDWETVLRRIVFGLRDFLKNPVEIGVHRLVAAEGGRLGRDILRHWRVIFEDLATPLLAAQRTGRLAPDVDVEMTLTIIASTLVTAALARQSPPDDAFTERLLQQTLRGLRGDAGPRCDPQPADQMGKTPDGAA